MHEGIQSPEYSQVIRGDWHQEKIMLFMEHLSGGNISGYLEDHYRMTEEEARSIFHQLVSPVQHSQQGDMVHRDIRQRTCSLMLIGTIKIVDQEPRSGITFSKTVLERVAKGGLGRQF
ncbi:hypothetical protein QTO34_007663 [Cnephaeus nilssonii]|uniref:non-specific serine/threonine protein kinase n=1 Tax=Cnephaeus nilssonii TaxID=3371016 RepID=A0AA40HJU7_CNENI|nr:hypothetical protein QTO34_007663 [Eptesicus nilssonii]